MAKSTKKMSVNESISDAADALRDVINWVEVWNLEELEDNYKKIEDDVLKDLKEKLEKVGKKIEMISLSI